MASPPRYRPMDGYNANPDHPTWGTTLQPLEFVSAPQAYADNVSGPAGPNRDNARFISDVVFTAPFQFNINSGVSSLFSNYGQFLASDMSMLVSSNHSFNIQVPRCDMGFGLDPNCTGTKTIPFTRHSASNTSNGYLQGKNDATAWLDLSNVYGLGDSRTAYLRTFTNGTMKTSQGPTGELLPYNLDLLPNLGPSSTNLFLAGDPRCNLNLPLLAIQTLFVLEHNKRAATLKQRNPTWDDETLFQEARRYTIAVHQKITYFEYLPKLLSAGLDPYSGFKPDVSPAIDVAFITAAFRYGHSSTNQLLYRLQESRVPVPGGPLNLADTILNPQEFRDNGMENVLRGLILQPEPAADANMVDAMRTGTINGDMAAVDIQRGRDRGVPDYNTVRVAVGLPRATKWSDISSIPDYQQRLAAAYQSVDDVDLYVGGLAEDRYPSAITSQTFAGLIAAQFLRTRNADPFFYQRPGLFSTDEMTEIQNRTLANMILDHTQVQWLPTDVFQLEQIPTGSSTATTTTRATGYTGLFSPLPGYSVSWAISSDCVWSVQIVSTRGGWAGIGFGTQMAGADIILCYMDNGAMTCADSWVPSPYESMPLPDYYFGHSDDIAPGSVSGQILGGALTARFSRKCNTGDSVDHIITNAMAPMIFAHGPTAHPAQHGLFGRAQGTINLFTNEAVLDGEDVFHLGSASSSTFAAVGFILLALQVITLLFVLVFRKTRHVFFQGPPLLITMLLGSSMLSTTLVLTTLEQSAAVCAWRLFLSSTGFTLVFSILLGKLYRYSKIFFNKSSLTVKVTNVHILSATLGMLTIDVLLCGIWVGVSPMDVVPAVPNTCPDSFTASVISWLLIVVKGGILLTSAWLYRGLQTLEGRTASMFKADFDMAGQICGFSLTFLGVMLLVSKVSASTAFQRTILLIQCLSSLFVAAVPYVWYMVAKALTLKDDVNRKSRSVAEVTQPKKSHAASPAGSGTFVFDDNPISNVNTEKRLQIKYDDAQKALTEFNLYAQLTEKANEKFSKLKAEILQMEAEAEFRNQID